MLTKFDEFTCHQIVAHFDETYTTERAWTEKLWVNIHDKKGGLVLATGFGVYPNRNVLDGYACVNVGNREQVNIRASRELRPRIDEIALGPLSYEVREPWRRIAVACAENDRGLSYDLEFAGKFVPGDEDPPQYAKDHGRVTAHTRRYAQLGTARGWIRVDGKRFEVNETDWIAQRDHSWGIRMGVGAFETGVQAMDIERYIAMMINWITLQFEDWGICCYFIEQDNGDMQHFSGSLVFPLDSGKPNVPVVKVEHEYEYHPGTQRMKSGRVVFRMKDGTVKDVTMREMTCMYLRGGGYVGFKGFRHGTWMGQYWEDGERWNVGDPAVADDVHGLDDTVIEVTCEGRTGYGIIENMIIAPYRKYGFTQLGFKPA